MDYKQLQLLDFSQGIRSSEVMHNDLCLQEQIERERLTIAGYGINFGLDLKLISDWQLEITEGTVVDKEGKEKFITGKIFNIEKPNLILRKQKLFSTNKGVITLNDIPYSELRDEPAQYADSNIYWGIEAYYEDDPSTPLYISGVNQNIVYSNSRNDEREILINYNVAYDRIDTVYINNEYELAIKPGIDSTTPSAYIPEDCKYVLGFVKVVSMYFDEKVGHDIAKASLIKEFDNRRTVYTDADNNLYLCGIPFESLLRIYFEEPKNPKEGMLWYDMDTNKLKIWRRTDYFVFTDIYNYTSSDPNNPQKFPTSVGYREGQLSVYLETRDNGELVWTKLRDDQIEMNTDLEDSEVGVKESKEFRVIPKLIKGSRIKYTINRYDDSYYWVPINDTSYLSAFEYKMWAPDETGTKLLEYLPGLNLNEMREDRPNHDLKTFLFRKDELHLRFNPHKNELDLMIDQIPLHRDQFVELTVEDILNSTELTTLATLYYGWTTTLLQELKDDYKEVGIGFKLLNPLDRPGYVEVNIQHRVNDSILKNKFQRNATFAKTETIKYTAAEYGDGDITINTLIPYRYGEEQLEVFVDGLRLKNSLVIEKVSSGEVVLGNMCKSFTINTDSSKVKEDSEITYKITTNVYSYDHVDSIMREYEEKMYKKISDLEATIEKLNNKIDNLIDF